VKRSTRWVVRWGPPLLLAGAFMATMVLRLTLAPMAPEAAHGDLFPALSGALPLAVWRTLTGLFVTGSLCVTFWPRGAPEEGVTGSAGALTSGHLFPLLLGLMALPRQGLAVLLVTLGVRTVQHRSVSRLLMAGAVLLSLPVAWLLPGLLPRGGQGRRDTAWAWKCVALLVLPLTIRILVGLDLATLERLVFGVGSGAGASLASLWSGFLEGILTLGDGLRFLALSWGQPSRLLAGLLELETGWVNPPMALFGAGLLLLPLIRLGTTLGRKGNVSSEERQVLLLLAGLVGAGATPWFDGETVVLSLAALPIMVRYFAATSRDFSAGRSMLWLGLAAVLAETAWGLLTLWGNMA
jgi:hypothetical protein